MTLLINQSYMIVFVQETFPKVAFVTLLERETFHLVIWELYNFVHVVSLDWVKVRIANGPYTYL